jgi:hypothetical protein
MKFIAFWAVIIFAIYYFSKKKKSKLNATPHSQTTSKAGHTQQDSAIIMVECAHCKTHFPNNESIDYLGETFCSVEHKNLGRK